MNSIEIVKGRIRYLEELAAMTPISKAYIALTRLEEAKAILAMLQSAKGE